MKKNIITLETMKEDYKLLKHIYELYIRNYGNKKNIKELAELFGITIQEFMELVTFYLEKNQDCASMAFIFDKLMLLENEEDIIIFLVKENLTYEKLRQSLPDYITIYRPDLLFNENEFNNIMKKLNIYKIYKESLSSKYKKNSKNAEPFNRELIQRFINSKYTLKKFSFLYKVPLGIFKTEIAHVKNHDPLLYQKYLENYQLKEAMKNETIENDVLAILKKIKELGTNFNSIDFFNLTDYSPIEIIEAADRILNQEDDKIFRRFISVYKTIKIYSPYETNQIFTDKLVFSINGNSIEITENDKHNIVNYLKENDFPISTITFKDACLKYYNGILFNEFVK